MNRILVILIVAFMLTPARAIESGGSYDTTEPTDTQIPNWTTGWGAGGITGWDYLGQVNGASAVYLGNGWVLTAGHVNMGTFTTSSGSYAAVAGSGQSISNANGTADLILFQIATWPNLPLLTLSLDPPVAFSSKQAGTSVAMLGFGGGNGLTWGLDAVTEINELVTPQNYTYVSNDFFTDNGTITRGKSSITNNATLVDGDSGGGDFTFNSTTGKWELAGINEVVGQYPKTNETFSGMVQLNTYASQIIAIVDPPPADTPAMPFAALGLMACLLFWAASRSIEAESSPARVLAFERGERIAGDAANLNV